MKEQTKLLVKNRLFQYLTDGELSKIPQNFNAVSLGLHLHSVLIQVKCVKYHEGNMLLKIIQIPLLKTISQLNLCANFGLS